MRLIYIYIRGIATYRQLRRLPHTKSTKRFVGVSLDCAHVARLCTSCLNVPVSWSILVISVPWFKALFSPRCQALDHLLERLLSRSILLSVSGKACYRENITNTHAPFRQSCMKWRRCHCTLSTKRRWCHGTLSGDWIWVWCERCNTVDGHQLIPM